jgi:glycerate-2-kinase
MRGARWVGTMLPQVEENDLVIVRVTGGCTSLTAPPKEITFEEIDHSLELLLRSSASIGNMNVVGKQLLN